MACHLLVTTTSVETGVCWEWICISIKQEGERVLCQESVGDVEMLKVVVLNVPCVGISSSRLTFAQVNVRG